MEGEIMQDEILTTFAGRDAIGLSTVKDQCQQCGTTGQLYAFWVHMPHPYGFTNGNMREGAEWTGSGSSDWWGNFCGEGCFQEYSAGRKREVERWEKVMQDKLRGS
jgi:hypothetical protein